MARDGMNTQRIPVSELNDDVTPTTRKASRIELRTLRDAYSLKTADFKIPSVQEEEQETPLRRMTAYCTAESYNLKQLHEILKKTPGVMKVQLYFGECLFASYNADGLSFEMYFMNYGVTVLWGFETAEEEDILRLISPAQENPYDQKNIEVENFNYGISRNPQICNDRIYLSEDNFHAKIVISIAVAQSVKLDYFEELVDSTIDTLKELPDEVEKEGKVGKSRKDILRIMGRLYKLSFNLFLVSNILSEPEYVWEYASYSSLYETSVRYMDIKTRTDLLNKRIEIIHGILEILSENITTHNSEKLEFIMVFMISISAVLGFLQCLFLLYICLYKKGT